MAAVVLHLQMKDAEPGRRTGLARPGHPAVRQMLTESGYAVEPWAGPDISRCPRRRQGRGAVGSPRRSAICWRTPSPTRRRAARQWRQSMSLPTTSRWRWQAAERIPPPMTCRGSGRGELLEHGEDGGTEDLPNHVRTFPLVVLFILPCCTYNGNMAQPKPGCMAITGLL